MVACGKVQNRKTLDSSLDQAIKFNFTDQYYKFLFRVSSEIFCEVYEIPWCDLNWNQNYPEQYETSCYFINLLVCFKQQAWSSAIHFAV